MVASVYVLLPFQGVRLPFYLIPRALPWAMECCPFRAQPFLHWLWLWLSLRPPTVGSFQSLTVGSSLFTLCWLWLSFQPPTVGSSLFTLRSSLNFPLFFCSFRKMRYLCRWTSWRIVPQAHDADASKPQSTPSLLQVFQLATKEVRVGNEARHNKGVYLTLCLRRTESRKFTI